MNEAQQPPLADQLPSTISSDPPLNLPRFTFMIGGDYQQNFNFAKRLQSENEDLLIYDMKEPLRDATSVLFYGEWRELPERLPSGMATEAWLNSLSLCLENNAGIQ